MTRSLARLVVVALFLGGVAIGASPAPGSAQEGPSQADVPQVLVFSATYGFRHPSIMTGNATLEDLAEETGAFEPTFSENPTDLNAESLRNYDMVLFNQTTGRFPLSPEQRQGLERYWGCGGGTVGIHASTDANYGWPAYAELWGAQFSSHPQNANDPAVRLLVENRDHPANAAYADMEEWIHQDELYRWQRDVRGRQDVTPLLALDENTVRSGVQEGAEAYWARQPLSWAKTFRGAGRVYYNNLGHNDATYSRPEYRQSLVDGITWVSQVGLDAACFDGDSPLPGAASAPAPGPVADPCVLSEGQTAITVDAAGEQRVTGTFAPRYFGYGKRPFVLDLSGTGARAADVTVELSWLNPANDFDLGVTAPWGFAGSDAAQPPPGSSETVVLPAVPHCTELLVSAYNWQAVNPSDADAPRIRASAVAVETPTEPRPTDSPSPQPSDSPSPQPSDSPSPQPSDSPSEQPSQQPPPDSDPARVERAQGRDRVATAAAVSAATFPQAGVVVLARADEYADALAGAPLAAQVGGPLLLTAGDRLSEDAGQEIRRLGAREVVLLGGDAALSPRVAAELAAEGVRTRRVAGADRFATAAAVADELPDSESVYLAEGANADPARGWPDALSAAGAAAALRAPVLLTTRDDLPEVTAEHLDGRSVTVVGGPAAVSTEVEAEVAQRALSVRRLSGANRYGTSEAVARDALRSGASPRTTWAATGTAFPDALGAGAAAGSSAGVLVLVDGGDLESSPETRRLLAEQADQIRSLRLAGGPEAISDRVEAQLRGLVEG